MTDPRENLTENPDGERRDAASVDLLSHVLAQIRLTGDGVEKRNVEPAGRLDLLTNAAYVVVVTGGVLRVDGDDAGSTFVEAGDLLLLPHGIGTQQMGATEIRTDAIVCRFWFDPYSLRSMISALPGRIHIQYAQSAEWLDGMIHFMMRETIEAQPGTALMISRIIDLLVIRTLRTWIHQERVSGWLGGLSDARIARALKVMHERPMRPWSIDELAEVAGMSRSSFAERFTILVGRAPLRYQNERRLNLARDMLTNHHVRVGEVGLRIGYASEAAFSRAYKALFGHPPRSEKQGHL